MPDVSCPELGHSLCSVRWRVNRPSSGPPAGLISQDARRRRGGKLVMRSRLSSVVTQLVTQRPIRTRPYRSGRVLTCEPPRGIEPRTCSLRRGQTPPTMASTSDNSYRSHTFGCTSGTVRPDFAPRLIPRRAGRTMPGSTTGRRSLCRILRDEHEADLSAGPDHLMVPTQPSPPPHISTSATWLSWSHHAAVRLLLPWARSCRCLHVRSTTMPRSTGCFA
jgi:hypothetical protein